MIPTDLSVWFLQWWCLLSSFREGCDQTGAEKEKHPQQIILSLADQLEEECV